MFEHFKWRRTGQSLVQIGPHYAQVLVEHSQLEIVVFSSPAPILIAESVTVCIMDKSKRQDALQSEKGEYTLLN